ncbi:hypothetical protein DVH05_013710 [Phytophthora capsici]|nr:hypothetical protein DVH05_013710 [Phytophthora capsici]
MVPRRCLKSAEYLAELSFDKVILQDDCVFRMRKPDWKTNEKTSFYNKLHQMRLAMIQTHATSLATIFIQKKLRMKYSSDLRKAQESIHKLEEIKINTLPTSRKMTTEQLCVDSDVFDSFSKQLIDAETLVPNLRTRLEKANFTIATEKKNIKLIRQYVQDFAVRKLQTTIRAFFRFRRWKKVLKDFHEDVSWSAAVEIQTIWRMFTAKRQKRFLLQLRHDEAKAKAANVIRQFLSKISEAKRQRRLEFTEDTDTVSSSRKQKALDVLFAIFGRSVLHEALVKWKEKTYELRIRRLEKTVTSVILIQKIYRGFLVRTYLKRIKIRNSLTDRVGKLVDQFIVAGDFWGFVLAIDADYRRFSHQIAQEEADATTFMSTVLHRRKLDEERMMQDWFTASALDNPLVAGIEQVTTTYSTEERHSSENSVSQAMLHSALVEDLVALSPNKNRDDLFPAEFPASVIRHAMAKGFVLDEVVAVMRGLQAQGKVINDTELVISTLQKRIPLMTNSWSSERELREESRGGKVKTFSTRKPAHKTQSNLFVSENLLDSIPGGMNAPLARLLLVAALRCYDPGSRSEKGAFVPCEGRNSHLFQTYLHTESPLLKIRREQQAMEVVKPHLHTLLENRCYTAYDILYNVRGIGELVSWSIPGPLAASIYSVIQEIHVQSSHISKRNLIKEVRISVEFEQFLKARVSNASNPREARVEALNDNVLTQVQSRLETEVLGLPLRDVSIPASEFLFKAAFLVCGDSEIPTSNTYQDFLHSLMMLRTAEDTDMMKQRIAARVTQAKKIVDEHTKVFQLFGVNTAGDLMVRSVFGFHKIRTTLTACLV